MRRSLDGRSFAATLAGFSLFLSWPYCAFSMTSLLASSVHDPSLNNYCWIASLLFVSLTLLALSKVGARAVDAFGGKATRVAGVAVHAIANAVIVAGGAVPGVPGVVLVLVACAATGVATGFLHVSWGMRLATPGVARVPLLVPLAYACSFAEVLAVSQAPVGVRPFLTVAGILVAGAFLCAGRGVEAEREPDAGEAGLPRVAESSPDADPRLFQILSVSDYVVVFFCLVCVGFIDSLSRPSRMMDIAAFPPTLLAATVVAALLALMVMRLSRRLTFGSVSRVVAPVLSIGLLLSVWPLASSASLAYVMVFATTQITTMFIWIAGITHGVKSRDGVQRMLGTPLGVHYAGNVIGSAMGLVLGLVDPVMLAFFLSVLLSSAVILRARDAQTQSPIVAAEYIDVRPAAAQRVAARFGLSKRESEIFSLFVGGRNASYICEVCFISKNTVDTHLRHIYDKTGVRSKQGLIDLVEDEERSLIAAKRKGATRTADALDWTDASTAP